MTAPFLRFGSNATRRARGALSSLGVCLACAGASPATDAPAPREVTPAEPGSVRVQLFFGADADLDLYVTGPLQETVYFANSPSAEGGVLDADVRCDASPPRVETIAFPAPAPPGGYRVGVDFPVRCDTGTETVPFRVQIDAPQGRRELRGEAHFGVFEPRVAEFALAD